MNIERPSWPRQAAATLALLGLLDSLYLSLERITGGDLVCPVGGNSCATVQTSQYAVLFGVPVAYLGVLGYLALLALALLALNRDEIGGLPLPALLLGVSSVGVLFSAYLVYLQIAVIGAICFWCVVSALFQLAIWTMALIDWRGYRALRAVPEAEVART